MDIDLKYTLCFLLYEAQVLLLRRRYPPKAGYLNGVGGKRHPGESPAACILREVQEETGVVLPAVRFGGIVTWTGFTHGTGGMHVYLADLPPQYEPGALEREMDEGSLSWVPQGAILDGTAPAVENIPHFLGPMLHGDAPAWWAFVYQGEEMLSHTVHPLPVGVNGTNCHL